MRVRHPGGKLGMAQRLGVGLAPCETVMQYRHEGGGGGIVGRPTRGDHTPGTGGEERTRQTDDITERTG